MWVKMVLIEQVNSVTGTTIIAGQIGDLPVVPSLKIGGQHFPFLKVKEVIGMNVAANRSNTVDKNNNYNTIFHILIVYIIYGFGKTNIHN